MTACTCDTHTTTTTTPALTCTSTDTTTGNAIYASSMTTTALKVNGGASLGNAMEITPNVSNANGMYISISSGFGKCIALNHVGSAGGAGLYVTTNFGSGVYSNSTNGYAVQASSTNTTAITASSTAGSAIVANSTNGSGIVSTTTSSAANASAVFGTNNSVNGFALRGLSLNGVAVRGETNGNSSVAVWGAAAGTSSAGVVGHGQGIGTSGVLDNATGGGYGIYGYANTVNPSAWAGYFAGNVYVTGTVSKAAGTFTIDHPSDPKNKILNHSFVESPDMKNVYDGRGVVGTDGSVTIKLPDYFGDLNENFCYQLTCLGSQISTLTVYEEIKNNEFVVCGSSGQKFCWQVTGNRKDAYARKNPVVVEVEKTGEMKGNYLNPEAFGLEPHPHALHKHRGFKK